MKTPKSCLFLQVDSQMKRARAEKIASAVVNVQQVVNELQVKGQKVTSSQ